MFLHLSVLLFTGVLSAPLHAGIHESYPYRDPSGYTTHLHQTPPQTGTAADGMHSTGMHSCECKNITH